MKGFRARVSGDSIDHLLSENEVLKVFCCPKTNEFVFKKDDKFERISKLVIFFGFVILINVFSFIIMNVDKFDVGLF